MIETGKYGYGLFPPPMQAFPRQVARRNIGTLQSLDGAFRRTKIQRWHYISFMSFRRYAEDAAADEVADLVTADAGIIPVGNEKRTVGRHTNIGRTEPVVIFADGY